MAAFKFSPEQDGTLPLRTAVTQAIGAASVCWDGVPHGVFLPDRAMEIVDALMEFLEYPQDIL